MGLANFLRKLFGLGPAAPPSRPSSRTQAQAPGTSWPPQVPPGGAWSGPTAQQQFETQRFETVRPPPAPVSRPVSSAPVPSFPMASSRGVRPGQQQVSLGLDESAFQPLSSDQVKAAAEGQQFTGFWEFGRQSRIPSVLDPRTKLIDQAMVGQGLITPEELARIHELGEKMDELRPERVSTGALAERAVQADKEARRRIKAEKKAAAEERKRRHAERVAHNRLHDIVHLGRGVSAGLADRRSNVEKLQSQGLPILSTPADVAAALGFAVPRLRWLAYHAEASTISHYVQFLVP